MQRIEDKLVDLGLEYGPRFLGAIIALVIGFTMVKWIIRMLDRTLQKSKVDMSLHSFIRSVSNFMLRAAVIITSLMIAGVDMTTFIAILSAAGLAVGLALKDSLANFAGGILILIFRPFNVGDFIDIQSHSGTVKEIQLLYTYLCTSDNKRVIIPNGQLSNAKIVNFSVEETRRVEVIFSVSYDDDIMKVKEVLNKIVEEHSLIMKDPEPLIRVLAHTDSAINFRVRVWCKREDYWNVYYDLQEQVKLTFDKEGISIPFPRMDVSLHEQ